MRPANSWPAGIVVAAPPPKPYALAVECPPVDPEMGTLFSVPELLLLLLPLPLLLLLPFPLLLLLPLPLLPPPFPPLRGYSRELPGSFPSSKSSACMRGEGDVSVRRAHR